LCVVDGGTKRTCSSLHEILFDSLLGFLDKKLILVFNKVDMVENKADVLDRISQITGGIVGGKNIIIKNNKYLDRMEEQDLQYCRSQSIKSKSDGFQHFNRVFVTSSLDCTGLDDLKDFLFQSTVKGYWIYNCDMKVKATETDLLENYLIEKLLEYFPQNLIYRCKIVIDDPIAAMDIQYYKVKLYVKHFYRKKFLDHRMTHYLHEVCTMVNKHMSDILCRQVSVNVAFLDRECLNMS
ncbi:MAG: Era Like 12S Mitochondrial RRNA Chaperone 1, partial [Marteilia pararefringens]